MMVKTGEVVDKTGKYCLLPHHEVCKPLVEEIIRTMFKGDVVLPITSCGHDGTYELIREL